MVKKSRRNSERRNSEKSFQGGPQYKVLAVQGTSAQINHTFILETCDPEDVSPLNLVRIEICDPCGV